MHVDNFTTTMVSMCRQAVSRPPLESAN